MASNFSSPSLSESSFSLPQFKCSDNSERISTASALIHPKIVLKLSSTRKNVSDDVVSIVADQTLVGTNGEESTKDETKEAEKRKGTFRTFSVSLGREKIEADLLAMTGSMPSKTSAAKKKSKMILQNNSFQGDLSSFSADKSSSRSTGSCFNFAVETAKNKSTSSDGRRKITWKFSTVSNNKKNDDMFTVNAADQNQTLVPPILEEPAEKAETCKNKKKVSDPLNETLIAAELLHPKSTQLGIAPLTKDNRETKKRTFSTFSVSLTSEEIEADFLAMGVSMRTRRIKKRPKNVERQLDNLFPGLRLKYITPNSYRVRDDKN